MPAALKRNAGTLYVVATPIGNLADLSARAREVLAHVDLVAAEDTRHTAALLQSLGIHATMAALHEHNENKRSAEILEKLSDGLSVALVSDAGTPLISDPGFELVRMAIGAGVPVVPIPGPCAAVVALSAAGLPTDRFVFEGFLPARAPARRAALEALQTEARTLIFYESPHRLAESLQDVATVLGAERRGAIGRELTKHFETFYYGTLVELAQRATEDVDMQRGELVLVIAGAASEIQQANAAETDRLLRVLLEELPPAQAAKLAAKFSGARRSDLYDRAVRLSQRDA